jgi:hypothetical protein
VKLLRIETLGEILDCVGSQLQLSGTKDAADGQVRSSKYKAAEVLSIEVLQVSYLKFAWSRLYLPPGLPRDRSTALRTG